jgi:hypothetical protein
MGTQKTTNYDLFKKIEGNRELNPAHLAKLALSIAKKNLLEYAPIMVNESMEVIDGQHRLEVARKSKLPIYYTIVPSAGLDEVIELNTTLRNWRLSDFVDSMIVKGNKTMAYLREFCDEYNLSLSSGIILHVGGVAGQHLNSVALLQRLSFNESQREKALKGADLLFDIRQLSNRKGALPRAVVYTCRRVVEEEKDIAVSKAIKARGKLVAIIADQEKMYEILTSYLTK